MFLSRNYGLIVAPFSMFLKQICARKYYSFKDIKFPRSDYKTDISETQTLNCLYCFSFSFCLNFLTRTNWSIILKYFQFSWMKGAAVVKKKPYLLQQISSFNLFLYKLPRLFKGTFSRTSAAHLGILLGRASVSPPTNTIMSRDHFKPIRIGENVLNCKSETSKKHDRYRVALKDLKPPI